MSEENQLSEEEQAQIQKFVKSAEEANRQRQYEADYRLARDIREAFSEGNADLIEYSIQIDYIAFSQPMKDAAKEACESFGYLKFDW